MISFEDIKKYIKNEYGNNKTKIDEKGKIDKGALAIIHAVEKEGFEAYAVGGSVRDLLLGKVPHDWDITTSAHPEDIVLIAQKNKWKAVDNQGIRFGTVILILDGNSYEVTSFRSEFYGNDSHKPEEIRFAKTLKEDLSRRDFTINAMAVDGTGTIYDYFNGVHDLEHKILKTVGSAEERFKEDALRPFRACRFLGQLDFMADMEIVKAIPLSSERVKGLSFP